MPTYQTKQRRELLDYLSRHTDEPFTAKQLAEALIPAGISTSAVYRNLTALEKDGKLKRLVAETGRETLYRFTDQRACRDNLHLVCTRCGKTVHLGKESTEHLSRAIRTNNHFRLNEQETVLYGLCEACV